MSLQGTRLGPYQIEAPLGAGGMGQVYRAHDSRLGRGVAIKILPEGFADDPDRLRRFESEARAAAALSHPNILSVFDVGREDETAYLVTELLVGQTLRDAMDAGRPNASAGAGVPAAMPLSRALEYAAQIAEGLAAAHASGIVHRDLKPENVFVTTAGRVKILDFGLAKSRDLSVTAEAAATLGGSSAPHATAPYVILGTPGYMAPEQVRGEPVDHRADIFAFGCVLYELFGGTRAFGGATTMETLSAILRDEPVPLVSTADRPLPPALARVVARCLEKAPEARFQSTGDLAFALRTQAADPVTIGGATPAPRASAPRSTVPVLAVTAVGCVALGAAAAIGLGALRAPPPANVTRFTLPDGQVAYGWWGAVAVSPDGRTIAYTADKQIYLRPLGQLTPTAVSGTAEGPIGVVFSPDNQWLAYFAGGTLKKIPVSGGVPVTLAAVEGRDGMSWRAGEIVVAANGRVVAVPDTGGEPRVLVTLNPLERAVAPQVLADGEHVVFAVRPVDAASIAESRIVVERIGGGDRRVLAEAATSPRVLPGGRLVYAGATNLFGVAFDEQTLTIRGGPVPLVQGVAITPIGPAAGVAQYDVGAAGTLVFQSGTSFESQNRSVLWVNRNGQEEAIGLKPRAYRGPALSPDATRIAVADVNEQGDIWVWDLKRETLTRVTSGEARDTRPLWTPDGRSLIYTSDRRILRVAADGTSSPQTLLESQAPVTAGALSPDGRFLVYQQAGGGQGHDLMLLALDDLKRPPRPLVSRPRAQTNPAISPDGRWFVYQSNDSDQWEVYLSPFPDGDRARWQVSPAGGYNPAWSRRGDLFYLAYPYETGPVTAVTVLATGSVPVLGKPQPLFGFARRDYIYDVSPDGSRFLMTKDAGAQGERGAITVVTNWFEELRARVR